MHLKFHFPFLSLSFPVKPAQFLRRRNSSLNQGRKAALQNLLLRMLMLVSKLRVVRWVALFLGFSNLAVIFLGGFMVVLVFPSCGGGLSLPFVLVSILAGVKVISLIGSGIAQEATASMILTERQAESTIADAFIRHERRTRYKRWIWWTRFGMAVTIFQFVGDAYLMFSIVKYYSNETDSSGCFIGKHAVSDGKKGERITVVFFLVLVWFLVIIQCFTGSDVLKWRSFYETHDDVWKAHYREVFDYGIREALCCMGRARYLSVLEEDEVYSVARLLGDLVAYRASGTGHLELLAGLSLLHRHAQTTDMSGEVVEAPEHLIEEAAIYHPFAEAAYTGPLLDFGRNPLLFPCVWLYRQGVLSLWSRDRRPVLEGDNWWRGHAAAFLKFVKMPSGALRRGRVNQTNREAAYFVLVVHHLKSVVIAVRGTETPEDLITDGLCRECLLTMEDLDGIINSEQIPIEVKQSVLSSFPHYGHSGIVESARELFMKIDGNSGDGETTGFLSSLLRAGSECHGYNIRIVGHSLGGAVAVLLGLRLYRQYPNLHVYTYGALPCLDFNIAEACSSFVTGIVYGDEFSARLSVSSILRLRAAAITALSQETSANSEMLSRLAQRIFNANNCHESSEAGRMPTSSVRTAAGVIDDNKLMRQRRRHQKHIDKGVDGLDCLLTQKPNAAFADLPDSELLNDRCEECKCCDALSTCHDFVETSSPSSYIQPCIEARSNGGASMGPKSDIVNDISSSVKFLNEEHPEMYLPGFIIHIVPEKNRSLVTLWRSWSIQGREQTFRAYIANREIFKNIIVSPYMFLDHLPWRVHYALEGVLKTRNMQHQIGINLPTESHIV